MCWRGRIPRKPGNFYFFIRNFQSFSRLVSFIINFKRFRSVHVSFWAVWIKFKSHLMNHKGRSGQDGEKNITFWVQKKMVTLIVKMLVVTWELKNVTESAQECFNRLIIGSKLGDSILFWNDESRGPVCGNQFWYKNLWW